MVCVCVCADIGDDFDWAAHLREGIELPTYSDSDSEVRTESPLPSLLHPTPSSIPHHLLLFFISGLSYQKKREGRQTLRSVGLLHPTSCDIYISLSLSLSCQIQLSLTQL